MIFGNLLVTIPELSVLDRACAIDKLQAGLFRLGLLNCLETESLQPESVENNSTRRMTRRTEVVVRQLIRIAQQRPINVHQIHLSLCSIPSGPLLSLTGYNFTKVRGFLDKEVIYTRIDELSFH